MKCFTVIVLVLVCLLPSVEAQTPPCPAEESRLEIGLASSSGITWSCDSDPYSVVAGKMRTRSLEGTWTQLGFVTFVNGSPNDPAYQAFLTTYPWLAPPTLFDCGAFVPNWAGKLTYLRESYAYLMLLGSMFNYTSAQWTGDAVKDWFQPICDQGLPSILRSARIWNAQAPLWLSDPNGSGIGPIMAAIWSGATDPASENPTHLLFEAVARIGILLQAPTPEVGEDFIKSADYHVALNLGLFVSMQALCLQSTDPGILPPTTDELTTPGLGLVPGFIPDLEVTNPITVHITLTAPLGNGPGGGNTPVLVNSEIRLDSVLEFRLRSGGVPPLTATFTTLSTQPTLTVACLPRPSLINPMLYRIVVPNGGFTLGPISLTNAALLTNSNFAFVQAILPPNPVGGPP